MYDRSTTFERRADPTVACDQFFVENARALFFFFCRYSGGGGYWQTRQHCQPTDRPTWPAYGRGRGKAAAVTTVDRGSLFRTDALLCPPTVVPHQLLLRSTGAERLSAAADVTVHLCRRYTFVLPTGRLPHVYICISIPYARYR